MSRLLQHTRLWALVYVIYGLPTHVWAENVTVWMKTRLVTAKERVVQTECRKVTPIYISAAMFGMRPMAIREKTENGSMPMRMEAVLENAE